MRKLRSVDVRGCGLSQTAVGGALPRVRVFGADAGGRGGAVGAATEVEEVRRAALLVLGRTGTEAMLVFSAARRVMVHADLRLVLLFLYLRL
jgi:hypothetical protein